MTTTPPTPSSGSLLVSVVDHTSAEPGDTEAMTEMIPLATQEIPEVFPSAQPDDHADGCLSCMVYRDILDAARQGASRLDLPRLELADRANQFLGEHNLAMERLAYAAHQLTGPVALRTAGLGRIPILDFPSDREAVDEDMLLNWPRFVQDPGRRQNELRALLRDCEKGPYAGVVGPLHDILRACRENGRLLERLVPLTMRIVGGVDAVFAGMMVDIAVGCLLPPTLEGAG